MHEQTGNGPERLSAANLNEWTNSGTLAHQVAAKLVHELRTSPRWYPVDSERGIVSRMDVSSTTVSIAKRLLAEHGVLMKHGRLYYVA